MSSDNKQRAVHKRYGKRIHAVYHSMLDQALNIDPDNMCSSKSFAFLPTTLPLPKDFQGFLKSIQTYDREDLRAISRAAYKNVATVETHFY